MSKNFDKIEKGLADLRQALKSERLMDIEQNQALLLSIKALSDCRPTPCWIKGTDCRMLYINPAYEKEFGASKDEYVGEKDGQHWDSKTISGFKENDSLVALSGESKLFIEDILINNKTTPYKILKWPVYINGRLIGIAGESLGVHIER